MKNDAALVLENRQNVESLYRGRYAQQAHAHLLNRDKGTLVMQQFILNQQPSAAGPILHDLRHPERQRDRSRFRSQLQKLGGLLGYEMSKSLRFQATAITTGLGQASELTLLEQPVLLSVLRAGLPLYQGVLEMLPDADSGFIGAYRAAEPDAAEPSQELSQERSKEPSKAPVLDIFVGYSALPEIAGRDVVLIDPMLATGSSLIKVLQQLIALGQPRSVHIVAAIAAPEGVQALSDYFATQQAHYRQSYLWLGALDQGLNSHAYIVPGLGDAGDLCFGSKR